MRCYTAVERRRATYPVNHISEKRRLTVKYLVSEAKLHLCFCWLSELGYGIVELRSKETDRLLESSFTFFVRLDDKDM